MWSHPSYFFFNIAWWGHFALYTSRCVCALRFFHHLKCSYFQSLFSAFGEVLNSNPTDSTLIFVAMKRTAAWLEVGQWLWDGNLTIQPEQRHDIDRTVWWRWDTIPWPSTATWSVEWERWWGWQASILQTACVNKPSGLLPLHCQKKAKNLRNAPGRTACSLLVIVYSRWLFPLCIFSPKKFTYFVKYKDLRRDVQCHVLRGPSVHGFRGLVCGAPKVRSWNLMSVNRHIVCFLLCLRRGRGFCARCIP